MQFTSSKISALSLTIALGAILSGCGAQSGRPVDVSGATGAVALDLQVGSGDTLASLSYDVSGNAFHKTGTVDLSSSTTISARIAPLPAGTGFLLAVTGGTTGGLSCGGSASFDVTAGATTTVAIHLTCHEGPATGSVLVGGTLNVCAHVDGLSALPAETTVGHPLTLTASAHDLDQAPAPLAFIWTSSAGTLVPAGATARFTCTTPGTATITLAVSDGDCGDSLSTTVTCTAPALIVHAVPAALTPGQTTTVTATLATGGATGPLTFGDGLVGLQLGHWSGATYTPVPCNGLGGGDTTITLSATTADGVAGSAPVVVHCPATYYTTKTPYQPLQDPATFEAPPAGFDLVFTEMVARHGSRGLSSLKYDAATLAMYDKAAADGALTPLGAQLSADVQAIMKANALLGYKVPGISNPGYGNLTQVGIGEHQQLAARLLTRLPGYFAQLGASGTRKILVVSSGVDRAVDSAAFFSQSLATHAPALAPLLTQPPAPVGYPANAPVVQPAGTNRFLLYFHKLAAKTDLVTNVLDPYYRTYQDSLAFQAYATDVDMNAKVSAILASPGVVTAARALLEGLFAKSFVDKIASGTYTFANTGTFSFSSSDGLFNPVLVGDGKTTVKSLADAASMLYNLYVIGPAMTAEAGVDLAKYIPGDAGRELAYLQDAQDFYQMGPSVEEANPVTYRMAQALENDFFSEIDAIAAGDLSHGAKLRFTHAEIMVPFASLLGLDGIFAPVPKAQTYAYETNPWRGELVSPMAANVQWDVYRDGSGALLVKMLYNEKEMSFKAGCNGARHAPGSFFYEYAKLKACYATP